MSENKNKPKMSEVDLEYATAFMPKVHKIGRATMLCALFLSYLPVIYFYFVKGNKVPGSTYLSGLTSIVAIGIGMWLSEPEAYWPVLGSAGTYIAYLSGNVGGMRFPVATTVQKNMNADITTPKGQVVTIVGIVASVVANLVILLGIVLGGEWILDHLPQAIVSSFTFVVISMLGSMLFMNIQSKGGLKGLPKAVPYIIIASVMWLLCNKVFPSMFGWGMAFAVGASVLFGYWCYRRDLAKMGSKK